MHVKKAHKVILSIFLTTLFLSLQFVVGGRLTYADGLKIYNSTGDIGDDFITGSYRNKTNGAEFKTILVYAEQPNGKATAIFNPTANGSYPIASYSFVGAGFSSISSNFSYTSSKEVVVSGLSLGHMYTTYSNSGIEQVVKLDGPDANQSTNFYRIKFDTQVRYYLEFGSIDTSIRPQFTATPSQYNGINYNLYSVDREYISSEEGTYNLTGFNLGSEIRWPVAATDRMDGRDLTLVQDVNVPQNGVYIYERLETRVDLKYGNVTVKYVDGAGNTISDNVVKSGHIGDDYSTDQKAIPGYTFKEVQGSASGQFTDQEQTVTYVYTKDPVAGANVTAKYVDENGKTISDDVVKNGNIGDDYSTEQKAIPGYTFKEVQGSASGQFTDQEQTVTYVYTKDPVAGANVTAKYVDENGKTISDDVVKNGNIGDDYSTEQKAIPGYTLNFIKYSASGGQFTDKEQTITYVYTKNSVTPVKPTEPGTTQTNENNTETPVKNTTNVSLNNNVSTLGSVSTTNEKSLPTTGEKPANWAVVVGGLIPLTAATVLYLLKRKY
ncbi:LPXTG cell wall anchor domain-containing protein (plasmid) [Pseudolactococcus raffinolactis]|uniref:MucBP domain-containing protein n=1 Tax=Pseudolactococcus raffinolactis TaxID=1366 RepID=UPI001437286E|nr:MucBP domain-containing protein [Lactococcus raffinolactis]QIW57370.1 LPXTG cell wall anchor domain-containing protein [Lactococcus raffinolactis]